MALCAAVFVVPGSVSAAEVETVLEAEFVTGIAFAADGKTMYFNEREGRVFALRGGKRRLVATVPTAVAGETGLLGIAVHPGDRDLYLFATDPGGASNRVVRLGGGKMQTIVSGLPSSVYHNGGGVAFDRDGNLLVSNGETHEVDAAQDPSVMGGKIYRFTPSGDAVPDNPFGDAIALGLRNPYGIAVDPVSGDVFATDNGPSGDDEVNRVRVGGNYGWPDVLGFSDGSQPSGPGRYFDPVSVQEVTVVPTGIAVADPATARESVAGDVFYGTFSEQAVRRIELNEARDRAVTDEVFIDESDGVVAVAWGPKGLYYSTTSAIKLVRLARPQAQTSSPSSPAPGRSIVGPPLEPDGDSFPWRLVVFAALLGALAVFVIRLRRRMPGSSR